MNPGDGEVTTPAHGAGCYVYAVVAGDATGVRGASGIEPGGPVEAVTVGDLTAVVSSVDLHAMREGGAATDLTEHSWLARAVRRHEQVVLAAFRSAPTVPMRFGIVHAERASVEHLLRVHDAELRGELARIAGTAEWSVKAFADREALAAMAADGDDDSVADTGRGYLLRERTRREARARVSDTLSDTATTLVGEVSSVARELVSLPVGGDESRRGVVAAACLVDRRDEQRLASIVATFAEAAGARGISVELTGPWPPYHFTTLRLEAHHG